ncbi:hypothetical protein KFK09_014948 [Dendrobium nobile]|uniref:DUF1664 domain-containing protein n=1 Tax=Dendrobium nobile TaxID=94219 RepID=A0A8T3B4K1_DENNO|nr:hypothetical protein KFK09_014948 [Dendrobium nobile]
MREIEGRSCLLAFSTTARCFAGPLHDVLSSVEPPPDDLSSSGPPFEALSSARPPPDFLSFVGPSLDAQSSAGPPLEVLSSTGPPLDALSSAGSPPDVLSSAGPTLDSLSSAGLPHNAPSSFEPPMNTWLFSVFFPILRRGSDQVPMAMQTGLSSSKVLILMGAGLTGSIILRNGRLSDVISELQGWSFSDVMFVTKRNMANAVANVSKQLEQLSAALTTTKRHLTQRLEKLDYKLDEQKESTEIIMKEVHGVKTDLSQIGFDIQEIQYLLSGLEGKMELLESKQDATNLGISYLCQIAGGIKDGLHTKFIQEATANFGSGLPSSSFIEDKQLQGLQFLAETLKPREAEFKGINTHQRDEKSSFRKPLTVHRLYQTGISLKKDGLLAL